LFFAGLFIFGTELGRADEAFPPVDELVKRVLVQEEADRQHQAGLEYSFNLTTEHYDASGQRTSAQTVRASAKAKAIEWRGCSPILRCRHHNEGSVFLRTSATSLYTQQLSYAARQLNGDSILRTFAPLLHPFVAVPDWAHALPPAHHYTPFNC